VFFSWFSHGLFSRTAGLPGRAAEIHYCGIPGFIGQISPARLRAQFYDFRGRRTNVAMDGFAGRVDHLPEDFQQCDVWLCAAYSGIAFVVEGTVAATPHQYSGAHAFYRRRALTAFDANSAY
jgi:hypothetical protein